MDEKYIEENKLTEARKRFQQINEYILNMNGETSEAQDDNAQEPQPDMQGGQQPPMDNTQQQPMDGNQPQQNMGQQPPMDANGGMSQDANQQMPQDDTLDPTIGAEAGQDDNMPEPDENGIIEPELPEEGDEVIDVDDLTQSQETTEYKLDGVDDKLNTLINIVSKFAEAIDDNDEKIEDLKREIAERNPSQQERLNIRSMSGSPYTVSPQDYWSEQNKNNPQYNVIADNDVDPDKEEDLYTITDDDIKNFNKSEIEKSINDIPMNLKDYFYESKNEQTLDKNINESFFDGNRKEKRAAKTMRFLKFRSLKKELYDNFSGRADFEITYKNGESDIVSGIFIGNPDKGDFSFQNWMNHYYSKAMSKILSQVLQQYKRYPDNTTIIEYVWNGGR